ncbi:MAG: hydrogenase expression/formation protein HypE [Bacteroidota bacterium]
MLSLNCPLPKLNFDTINLGHGSGGKLTNQLLDSGVFELLSNEWLDQRHDGAILECHGPMAFTTDSFVINPIFFPGGSIGELAINGTVNDLAMCGAIPKHLSLSFIIEEGLPMIELWEILLGIRAACQEAGVYIVTGDTKVVERGKGDKIFINTTGLGQLHAAAKIDAQRIEAGDAILVSGQLATHGMAIMSVREGLDFDTEIVSDTRPLNHLVSQLLDQFGANIKLLRDPTRGGVATVLNEIARDTKLGIDIRQRDLPLNDQVAGACELLGLDPLYVANEGIFLAVVDQSVAEEVLSFMQQLQYGAHATQIGSVTTAHPQQVVQISAIGGQRIVPMLIGEQLPRIC